MRNFKAILLAGASALAIATAGCELEEQDAGNNVTVIENDAADPNATVAANDDNTEEVE